jgi:trimethylamine:corrinoid methyltransferase-like protein
MNVPCAIPRISRILIRSAIVNLTTFKVLSDSEILQIHEATLDILEHCGVKIGSSRMFSFLQAAS